MGKALALTFGGYAPSGKALPSTRAFGPHFLHNTNILLIFGPLRALRQIFVLDVDFS